MSKQFGRAGHLLRLADEKGLDGESCDNLIQLGHQADLFEAAAAGLLPGVDRDKFREVLGLCPLELLLRVKKNITLKELIKAGNYDWFNLDITPECFPVEPWEGARAVELIHFNKVITSDEAETELDKMGYRPATITELLVFGAAFPEKQQKFPILALGSVASLGDRSRVASLGRYGSERRLYLVWHDDCWREPWRFLAARKTSES